MKVADIGKAGKLLEKLATLQGESDRLLKSVSFCVGGAGSLNCQAYTGVLSSRRMYRKIWEVVRDDRAAAIAFHEDELEAMGVELERWQPPKCLIGENYEEVSHDT